MTHRAREQILSLQILYQDIFCGSTTSSAELVSQSVDTKRLGQPEVESGMDLTVTSNFSDPTRSHQHEMDL